MNQYFDIKALFTKQIGQLTKEKPRFVKQIEINGEKETKETGSIDWKKELDPFVQMDINKPANLGSYEAIETDSTIKYTLKSTERKQIKAININKEVGSNQILWIQIESSDENVLYSWNKKITGTFKNAELEKYNIEGEQKILIFDKESYHVMGTRK
ncbi:MAG: hypothetical protein V4683_16480 [Bacteroidota bacterium]